MSKPPAYILPLIVFSQFAGTSVWFAGNAALPDLQQQFNLGAGALASITSAVQFGFISGTFLYAIFSIADRFSPSRVFFVSSVLAAIANLAMIRFANDLNSIMVIRFMAGFFLAGIYPVGMKIAADWYQKGLGKALGFLVGALVLGTALPYLLKSLSLHLPWTWLFVFTSLFAVTGGLLVWLFIKDGPYRRKSPAFHPRNSFSVFRLPHFRSAAFGYFGHMWELYTFWAFVPLLLELYSKGRQISLNNSRWSFIILAAGFLGCVAGGFIASRKGSARVAFISLLISGSCCLVMPLLLKYAPVYCFLPFLIVWGISVVSDSPQFSALVAQTVDPALKGTALTIVTCIGFSITIASIQIVNLVFHAASYAVESFLLLAAGPLTGLLFLYRLVKK